MVPTMRVTTFGILRVGLGIAVAAGALTATRPACQAAGFEAADIPHAVAVDDAEATEVVSGGDSWAVSGSVASAFDPDGMAGCQPAECQSGGHCDACDPPYGLVNRLIDNKQACWTFRTDGLMLWREAPRVQSLTSFVPSGATVPNAHDLNSPLAAGPRFSIFRTNGCGDALEATYFRAANWNAVNTSAAPGETYSASLGAAAQSFELNGRMTVLPSIQLLGGFRWFEWQENLYAVNAGTQVDARNCSTINDLYGYQIGFDSLLLSTHWLRVEALMKGGAYLNNARMARTPDTIFIPPVYQSAAGKAASFVGEVGMTGVVPVSRNIDFRFGYIALWLQGLAQPTNQPTYSGGPVAIDLTGATVLQGLTLGLEGRW
jgi:hypothetical protein